MTPKSNNRRSSFTFSEKLLFFAGILFCLVLITTAMMGGLFARYTTSATGEDDSRVAAFAPGAQLSDAVTVVCEKTDGEFNTDGAYTVTVTSDSEVAVRYGLTISAGDAFPAGISAALYAKPRTEDDDPRTPDPDSDPTRLVFSNLGTFPAGQGNSAEFDLIFTVDWSKIDFTKDETGEEISLILDFLVGVTVTQID